MDRGQTRCADASWVAAGGSAGRAARVGPSDTGTVNLVLKEDE